MENSRQNRNIPPLRVLIHILFLSLFIGIASLSAFYWFRVLEPQLMKKAEIAARALAKSNIQPIERALDPVVKFADISDRQKDIVRGTDKILLLEDPHANVAFIRYIQIIPDYEFLPFSRGSLDIERGKRPEDAAFVSDIPLYSMKKRNLLGIARVFAEKNFLLYFKKDVRNFFIAGALIILLLLLFAWLAIVSLMIRVERSEGEIREKQAQVIHAGRLSALGEMATGIAHEINQPLSIIRMAADGLGDFISECSGADMEKKAVDKIIEQVDRASTIIDNMRSFARRKNGRAEPVDLRNPIEKGVSFFREQFRIHGIGLLVDIPENPVPAAVEEGKFEQIVVNLLSNARFAIDEKKNRLSSIETSDFGRVHIRLYIHPDEKDVRFEIEDDGTGMTETVRKRCLEPFFTTRKVGDGTGLGLSIVHGIAKEFGMEIEIESTFGKGTLFRFRIKGI